MDACKVAKTFDIWSEIASKRRAKGVLTPASDCACQSRSSSQQPAQTAARQQPSVRPFAAHPPPTRCTAPHLTCHHPHCRFHISAPPAITRSRRRPCYSRPLPRGILPIGGLTRGCAGPPRPHTRIHGRHYRQYRQNVHQTQPGRQHDAYAGE